MKEIAECQSCRWRWPHVDELWPSCPHCDGDYLVRMIPGNAEEAAELRLLAEQAKTARRLSPSSPS